MYCIRCGTQLQDGMKFCTACGQPREPLPVVVETPEAPTVPAFSEPPAKSAVVETPEVPTVPAFSEPTAETAPPLMKTADAEPAFSEPPIKPAVVETPEAPTAPAFSEPVAEFREIEVYEPPVNKGLLITLIVACSVLALAVITAVIVWLLPSRTVSSSPQSQPTENRFQPIETTEAPTSATEATTTTTHATTEAAVDYTFRTYRVIANRGVAMYAAPSFDSQKVFSIDRGRVFASEECRNGEWVYTTFEEVSGWVPMDALRDMATERSYEPETYNMTGYVGVVETNEDDGVNMRTGPSQDYPVIVGVGEHKTVTIKAEKNGWYYVEYNGYYGWISGDYLQLH